MREATDEEGCQDTGRHGLHGDTDAQCRATVDAQAPSGTDAHMIELSVAETPA